MHQRAAPAITPPVLDVLNTREGGLNNKHCDCDWDCDCERDCDPHSSGNPMLSASPETVQFEMRFNQGKTAKGKKKKKETIAFVLGAA